MSTSKFSAADAALGYAYQVRCALVYSLQRARNGEEFEVQLEALDDVSFSEVGGEAYELLQLKHHLKTASTLTNAGEDLWKTIRIWVHGCKSGSIPDTALLWLVSTAKASAGSIAYYLRAPGSGDRDVGAALAALNSTAATSSSKANAGAYAAWCSLNVAEKEALIEQVAVLDGHPTITDIEARLAKEVWGSVGRDQIPVFVEYLEGWWFGRVIRQMVDGGPVIESGEIELKIGELREQFRLDNLPIDEDILHLQLDEALMESYRDHLFVRQLDLVTSSARRIRNAIVDYFKAFEQRSRWIRHRLVLDMEMAKYERRLVEEWERAFDRLRDRIGDGAAEEVMCDLGKQLLDWAETVPLPVRKYVNEAFVCRGSFHMLADEGRLGWHPNFKTRLEELLSKSVAPE